MSEYKLCETEDPRTGKETLWITKDGKSICPEDIVDDCNEMQSEIERLRAQLAAVSTDEWDRICRERDEAREAARRLLTVLANGDAGVVERGIEEYPWLEGGE